MYCFICGSKKNSEDNWEIYTDGGREQTNIDAVEWIKKAIVLGVGEVLITSIDRDGTQKGYEVELMKK